MATQTVISTYAPPRSLFLSLQAPGQGGPFALEAKFKADPDVRKVNLIIGAYRDDEAQPWALSSVTEAKKLVNVETSLHEYLPLRGNAEFLDGARQLVFGDELMEKSGNSTASIQTVSGTGANSLIASFLQKHTQASNVWLPDPTWVNHRDIWTEGAPSIRVREYPYYNDSTRSFDFQAMTECLRRDAEDGDVILLHACAHNPTGLDPTMEQWKDIAALCREKKLFVVFDLAYQGFTSGDLSRDAWAIRHFFDAGLEFAVCQSFSKNLGLYGERVGALHIAVSRSDSASSTAATVEGHLVELHRAFVSMAPLFGCRVAVEIFRSTELQEMWAADLVAMSGRIAAMRKALYDELVRLETPGSWEHIIRQSGMFSYTGLSPGQVERLQREHHVYMLPSGRASICGLTSANVKHTAGAIHRVVTSDSCSGLMNDDSASSRL